ncbi:MAG: pyrroline-5-carboxylate reductase [Planctomycetes bacterium]|nr:pyrroline-5-carboxylate reductase [Planctomycetota bacterium]
MLAEKVGLIGAGQMARALAAGMVRAGVVDAKSILASDPEPAALAEFARQVAGATTIADNTRVASQSDIIILAVKPQQMESVLANLRPHIAPGKLVVSVAAGVRLAKLAAGLAPGVRLVRVMPNAPCLVGQGASAYCLGPDAKPEDGARVAKILSAVGTAYELEEKLLDAVTGLSGSGPAFVCVVIEAMSDGGVRMGLPRAVATALAVQTVRGAAEMLAVWGEHPAALKDKVASPAGTTIAGLAALEAHGLRSALIAAVEAATRRSIELGES